MSFIHFPWGGIAQHAPLTSRHCSTTIDTNLTFIKILRIRIRDAYAGGEGGTVAPLPSSLEAGGARNALHTELFSSLLSSEWAFSSVIDSLAQENYFENKPPDPQICMVLLGDRYAKHWSSGKGFENQNLPLWKNIHIQRCVLRGSLGSESLKFKNNL